MSIIGRVQLVNSVISSMLVYTFHVYKWPKSLLNELSKLIRNFIWSGDVSYRKICTVSWKEVCKPRNEGGLAVKDPYLMNQASLLHLAWKLLTSNEPWAQLCRVRFLNQGKAKNYHFSSSIWLGMKPFLVHIFEHATWSIGNG